ncbi:MAG: hypothetical protein ACE5GR_05640 [Nitrosopumilus sp.]
MMFPKEWEKELEEFEKKVEKQEVELMEYTNAKEYLEWAKN